MSHLPRMLTLTVVAGMATSSLVLSAPAMADTTATVKAQTQRMTWPTLSSRQDGWYNPGDPVSLTCWKRGQGVKGYFSPNIPGGWDTLWYQTPDGHFVADVDIETGTLAAIGPECGVSPPPAVHGGSLRWPLDSVSVIQGFGAPGDIYRQLGQVGHNGIDLAAGTGTPVYAAGDGTIDFEGHGENNSWMGKPAGICILIRHADIYTGYAHLSQTVINKGQQVSKGQLIGYTGRTGAADGPHLHFEVLPLHPDFNNGYAGRIDPSPHLG